MQNILQYTKHATTRVNTNLRPSRSVKKAISRQSLATARPFVSEKTAEQDHFESQANDNSNKAARAIDNSYKPTTEYDTTNLELHNSSGDRALADSMNARAFTYGNHVWLGTGESENDSVLMNHELTHVIQQNGGLNQGSVQIASSPLQIQRKTKDEYFNEPQGWLTKWLQEKAAPYAQKIRGFKLLSFVLGKNPISQQVVTRSSENMISAISEILPIFGNKIKELREAGVIQRALKWLNGALIRFDLKAISILSLLKRAMESLSIFDLGSPIKTFNEKIKPIFSTPILRLQIFLFTAFHKLTDFVIEGALILGGPFAAQVFDIFKKGKGVLKALIKNPLDFISNLMAAFAQGFRQFSDNILSHLKTGLVTWVLGSLAKGGLQLPEKFDLKGVFFLVTQIFGLTYEKIRRRLVTLLGEQMVSTAEHGLEILGTLIAKGVMGAWELLTGYIGSLKDMVLTGIRDWIMGTIIKQAIVKLLALLNPAGAIVQAVIGAYQFIATFIERAKQIGNMLSALFSSILEIAKGRIGAAANAVESSLSNFLSIAITFMARFVGLGGIGKRIQQIIKKVQAPVYRALDRLVGFIAPKISSFKGKVASGLTGIKMQIGKVSNWFKLRKKFTGDDQQDHQLFHEGEGETATLMVASKKQPAKNFIERADTAHKNPQTQKQKEQAQKDAIEIYANLVKAHKQKITGKNETEKNDSQTSKLQNIDTLMEQLKVPLSILFNTNLSEPSSEPVHGSLTNTFGSSTEIKRLNLIPPKQSGVGSPPSESNDYYDNFLNLRRTTNGKSYYVRGHLLNEKLHGKGAWKNMVPLTRQANSNHEKNIENLVKAWVQQGLTVNYSIVAEYQSNAARSKELIESFQEETGNGTPTTLAKTKIVEKEALIPYEIVNEAVAYDGSEKKDEKKYILRNTIESDPKKYYLEKQTGPETINVNKANKTELQKIAGIGPKKADKIIEKREETNIVKPSNESDIVNIFDSISGVNLSARQKLSFANQLKDNLIKIEF